MKWEIKERIPSDIFKRIYYRNFSRERHAERLTKSACLTLFVCSHTKSVKDALCEGVQTKNSLLNFLRKNATSPSFFHKITCFFRENVCFSRKNAIFLGFLRGKKRPHPGKSVRGSWKASKERPPRKEHPRECPDAFAKKSN